MSGQELAPGWYPDPDDAAARRYWDGQTWSGALTDDSDAEPGARRSRVPWIVAAVAVLAAAGVVAFLLARGDSGKGGSHVAGYGQDAVAVAKKLHACQSVKRYSAEVARCVSASGDFIGIETEKDADAQGLGVAMMKDNGSGDCAVILKGVIISATTESALTEVVGVPEQFASDQGGYTLCPIP